MATKNIEIQDSTGNIYYPHTDAAIVKFGNSNVDSTLSDLVKNISNDVILTPSMNYGMNNVIKNDSKTSALPSFTIQGKTVVNLLGKDGNCEDASKWTNWQTATTLDASNKVFGTYGMKVALTSTQGNTAKLYAWSSTKYYCLSAYLKCGTASSISIAKDSNGGGTWKTSPSMTDTTKFNRTFVKLQPSDLKNGDNVVVVPIGTTVGQYGYVDGIMLEEITQAQYNDSTFTPSPYVDSYTCLQNPYVEVRHDNLVRNGNGEEGTDWWTPYSTPTLLLVGNKFQIIASSNGQGYYQTINVKANTSYYLSGNISGSTQIFVDTADGVWNVLKTGSGIFNTGSNTKVNVMMFNNSTGTGTADSIMLVEGTTAPSSYKSCRLERTVLETELTSDDTINYKNGEVTGKIWWKHKTLYGKDYDWVFDVDYAGFKRIAISSYPIAGGAFADTVGIKYDGKILPNNASINSSSDLFLRNPTNGNTYITIADSDTGWMETINPNNDEVKAFMNGWRTWGGAINGRYCLWVSIVDGSFPSSAPQTTITTAYTANSTTLVVADATKFSAGDYIYLGTMSWAVIGSISGNTLTLSSPCGASVASGATVVKMDNGSTDTRILSFCKNNIAPMYEGYQLHYKLQNPESITDDNCHIHGDIPLIDVGDNYLYLDSGAVLGEVTNPNHDTLDGCYQINNKWQTNSNDFLKNKTEEIFSVYKDNKFDNWVIRNTYDINSNGRSDAYIMDNAYDANAIYTVDYRILATIAPQIGSIGCSYSQDINSAISNIQESLNSKQTHDSILDEIVDLSLCEKQTMSDYYHILPHVHCYGTTIYVDFRINFTAKKTIPSINYSGMSILVGNTSNGNDYTNKFFVGGIFVTTNYAVIRMMSTDPTVVSNVDTYGAFGKLVNFTADCRGRI